MTDRPRIEVFTQFEPVAQAWAELEAVAPASVYQTMAWLRPWTETVGAAHKITPMLIVARAPDGAPAALFPFGVSLAGGLRLAEFLGGRDAGANIPLFNPDVSFTRRFMLAVLSHAAATDLRPDAFVLTNQPYDWEGGTNPMRLLPHQATPRFLYGAPLPLTREPEIGEIAGATLLEANEEASCRRILQAFFAQKQARLTQGGEKTVFDTPLSRAYFERSALEGIETGLQAIRFFALCAGDRIVATMGGGVHRGRFSRMVASEDTDPEFAQVDLADALTQRVLARLGAQGVTRYDAGVGERGFQSVWSERAEPLFDTLHGMTASGRAFCVAERNRRRLKRLLKGGAWLGRLFGTR
ncbi:MAG: family N-acetyltransferase [Hyphomicrobiales bacterium]|nr:family N-acetyltransferase [Hyphomicrobiales bacterium]